MYTIEQKLEAAMVLLETMSEVLMRHDDYREDAVEHRRLFDEATIFTPDIHAAGVELVRALMKKNWKSVSPNSTEAQGYKE